MRPKSTITDRLVNITAIVMVLLLSLLLLSYVGLGEAYRTYPKFEMDKFAAQGDIVKNSMQTFLLAGLPLEQFPGFSTLTKPILDADQSIAAIYVTDPKGEIIFSNSQPGSSDPIPGAASNFQPSSLQEEGSRYQVAENATYYQVSLEFRNKFEAVGNLQLLIPKSVISKRIGSTFLYVPIIAGGLLVIFAGLVFLITNRQAEKRMRWINFSYGLTFLTMAVVVIMTLINLYESGIQGKTEALANSLGQRLNVPFELGLNLDDFVGLDRAFKNYQELNPDVSFIALTTDGIISIHTDANLVGAQWESYPNHYEYDIVLDRAQSPPTSQATTTIHVGIPKSVIYAKLWRSVKNFLVLFVAAGFLSLIFFNFIMSFTRHAKTDAQTQQIQSETVRGQNKLLRSLRKTSTSVLLRGNSEFRLGLIRPFFFLVVFVEGLTLSFLPPYLRELALESNADPSLVSTIFTVYFASFVLVLIPAGRYAERNGIKPLLIGGALLTTIGFLLLATLTNFYAMFAIRAIAGIGQGMLFIGVQSYILEVASSERKTQGAAIIVFGYNGGMISGATIGALLAVYMGTRGVFITAGVIALCFLWYALKLIPKVRHEPEVELQAAQSLDKVQPAATEQGFMHNLRYALKDLEFVQTILLIGIPAKAILTGVTIFALPLLLARQNYAQEDIGQILMLYAAGVLISSRYVAPLADRVGKTTTILFFGAITSGLGLILIGLMGWDKIMLSDFPFLATLVLMAGLTTLGLAHGFIHAPIVTHIAHTTAAGVMGQSSATALYRFLERIGHVVGPILIGQLLFYTHESIFTITWIGLALMVLGLLFALGFGKSAIPALRERVST